MDDMEWLVAKLFKNGDISFTVNGTSVTLLNKSQEEIINYVTKRDFVEKLLTERRERASDNQKKAVREVMKELFGTSSVNEDDDAMMQSFQKYSRDILNEQRNLKSCTRQSLSLGKKLSHSEKFASRHSSDSISDGIFQEASCGSGRLP